MTRSTLPPRVSPPMLDPAFWLERAPNADAELLTPDGITAFNAHVNTALGIPRIFDLPDALPAAQVQAAIRDLLPDTPRYTAQGQRLEPAMFENVLAQSLPHLPDPVPVRLGLAVRRTGVRALPTAGVITSRPFEYALDRIQETTIDAGWPVAILTPDVTGNWLFCLTPHYWGWLRTDDIATGAPPDVAQYATMTPFVVTLANRGLVSLGADGGCTPQMGSRLPLHEASADLWLVAVPGRAVDGTLTLKTGFTPAAHTAAAGGERAADADFIAGYLPPTPRSVIMQAFKLMGEPYAWGGSRLGIFGRDCSRLVRDVYATTGILLPRNGDQQEHVCRPLVTFAPEMSAEQRRAALLESAVPGAILVLPGHVMIYLGAVEGIPYVIHATMSDGYDRVVVSDLSLGAGAPDGSLLDRLTSVVIPA